MMGIKSLMLAGLMIIFYSGLIFLHPIPTYAQTVDLLWQGETYTHPFYQGKSLWSRQSRITLVAVPQGLGNSANLNYKWTKNGTILGNINGVGRNYLSFVDSVFSRPQTIEVEIVSGVGEVLASASTLVTPTTSTLSVYENNPLYGFMFNNEVGEMYELKEGEATFTAFPFFFSTTNRWDTAMNYEWRTNAGGVETSNSATYRAPENTAGSSEVVIRASNKNKIMQTAGKSFLIEFGK